MIRLFLFGAAEFLLRIYVHASNLGAWIVDRLKGRNRG